MGTTELEINKAELARKILDETDERIILSMVDTFRKLKRNKKILLGRDKIIGSFMKFVSQNSISAPGFKFDRDSCYER